MRWRALYRDEKQMLVGVCVGLAAIAGALGYLAYKLFK